MVENRAGCDGTGRIPATQMTYGGCDQKARHRCRSNMHSMADTHKPIRQMVPRKALRAITLETGQPAVAKENHGGELAHCSQS